jgi:hypothetical protein
LSRAKRQLVSPLLTQAGYQCKSVVHPNKELTRYDTTCKTARRSPSGVRFRRHLEESTDSSLSTSN